MMNSAVGHLVRRGMEATFSSSSAMNFENLENGHNSSDEEIKLPIYGMGFLSLTLLVYIFAASMVNIPAAIPETATDTLPRLSTPSAALFLPSS
jgi:hypothetical protein